MTNPILEQARAALAAGHKAESQGLLAQVLQQEPNNEAAWLCMAEALDDLKRKRYCLQRVLAINPASVEGRRLLAELEHPPKAALASAPDGPAVPVAPTPALEAAPMASATPAPEAVPVSAPEAPAVSASPPAPATPAPEAAPVSAPEAPAVPVAPTPAPEAAPEAPAQAEREPIPEAERPVAVLLETAVWMVEQKRTGEGVVLLEKVVARDPGNETAWLWLAAATDDMDQKRRHLARVLEINPKSKMGRKLLTQLDAPPKRKTGKTGLMRG
jgi:hypothetical protein